MSTIYNAAFERLPVYYRYLKSNEKSLPEYISSSAVAAALSLGEVQVRKDLAGICSNGKPKVGYKTKELIEAFEKKLGFHKATNAVIVGAGKLGKALLDYDGFKLFGLYVIAAFDIKPDKSSKPDKIYLMNSFDTFCKENDVKIGIITTPADKAQEVCERMTANGIKAIWNFTQQKLIVPESITVRNEDLASVLACLSSRLNDEY